MKLRLTEIWKSFDALPTWVKVWMVAFLLPINVATLFFINTPLGGLIALLAMGGLLLNSPIVFMERGLSRRLAFAHALCWTPLVILLIFNRPDTTGIHQLLLWGLLAINGSSLFFDYTDIYKWLQGDRAISGAYT